MRTHSVPRLSRSDRRFTEHNEFFDVTCKRAFLCARFICWWTEGDHSKRNLRDMLNRLPRRSFVSSPAPRKVERHIMQSTTDVCISTPKFPTSKSLLKSTSCFLKRRQASTSVSRSVTPFSCLVAKVQGTSPCAGFKRLRDFAGAKGIAQMCVDWFFA